MIKSIREINDENLSIANREWTSDLLKAEGINYFLEAQEAIQSYFNTWNGPRRRDIALQVERVLITYLQYTYSEEEKEFLIGISTNNSVKLCKPRNQNLNLFKSLQELDPEGLKLLGIPQDIDIVILKKLYRKAAKKYHPDVGGSHKKMIKVIEVYSLFQIAISEFDSNQEKEKIEFNKNSLPDSWDSWNFSVYSTLAGINGTFLATDKAYHYLTKSYVIALSCPSNFISEFTLRMSDIFYDVRDALGKFKLKEEMKHTAIMEHYLMTRFRRYLHFTNNYVNPNSGQGDVYYNMHYGRNFVLNHPEKAHNAYRLGMIDKKRYGKAMKNFEAKLTDELVTQNEIDKFIKKPGFIQKLSKSEYETKLANTSQQQVIFPPDGKQYRFSDLTDNQKWEYLKAFSPKGTAAHVIKYSHIRCNEILLGLIQQYDSINISYLEKKLSFFVKIKLANIISLMKLWII